MKPVSLYVIAGEPSGDFLGAQLLKSIHSKKIHATIHGVGGCLMQDQGVSSLFPMDDISVMGIGEVLPKILYLLRRIQQTAHDIVTKKPDIVITIDAPDFCFRVAKLVKKLDPSIKFVHYVAPTVWAWRPKRAKKIAKFLDAIICLFDFEPPYFEKEGLKAIAVGHPMMETNINIAIPKIIGTLDSIKVGVFFGSRNSEIKKLSPVLLDVIKLIYADYPNCTFIIPTLPHLKNQIEKLVRPLSIPCTIFDDQTDKWSVFKSCDIAVAVSGTVGLELAACDVPHVIAYTMNKLTWQIIKRVIKTPYAHLANIILQEEIVPEFIQDECIASDIANELISLIENKEFRKEQKDQFIKVREKIGSIQSPSDKASDFILQLIK